jgi:hypothetical protein
MGVSYSYDDFTTKGHGVIEGIMGNNHTKYTGKKKSTKQKSKKSSKSKHTAANHKEKVNEAYKNLMQINRNAVHSHNKDYKDS